MKKASNNVCPNCGATMIDKGFKYHCEYCGTEVETSDDFGMCRIIVQHPKARVAKVKQYVPREHFDIVEKESYENFLYREISRKLAEFILNNGGMEIRKEYDPCMNQYIYEAYCRFLQTDTKL